MPIGVQGYSKRGLPKEPNGSPSSTTESESPIILTPSSILRSWLKPPWDDYARSGSERDNTAVGSTATVPVLACHRKAYFRKASIRAFQTSGGVKILQDLSNIQHPNIVKLYDVYLSDEMVLLT
jgi:hypothetical protein